jgi:hypothetical protein
VLSRVNTGWHQPIVKKGGPTRPEDNPQHKKRETFPSLPYVLLRLLPPCSLKPDPVTSTTRSKSEDSNQHPPGLEQTSRQGSRSGDCFRDLNQKLHSNLTRNCPANLIWLLFQGFEQHPISQQENQVPANLYMRKE